MQHHRSLTARGAAARRTTFGLALGIALGACGGGDATRGDSTAATATPGADTSAGVAAADPTRAPGGGAAATLPAGYQARTDAGSATLTGVTYAAGSGTWDVETGPAHVVWNPADTARGAYVARTRIVQRRAPSHPEAFGLFVGGTALDADAGAYTYFVVRGTGEYLVRVREGGATRDVQPWTAAPAVAQQSADGGATYDLAVDVGADSVRFLVGGQRVHAVAAGAVPTAGTVGLRINHNLALTVTPPTITRR